MRLFSPGQRTINGAQLFWAKYYVSNEPTADTNVQFNYYIDCYAPQRSFILNGYCAQTERERFEPVFEKIIDSLQIGGN